MVSKVVVKEKRETGKVSNLQQESSWTAIFKSSWFNPSIWELETVQTPWKILPRRNSNGGILSANIKHQSCQHTSFWCCSEPRITLARKVCTSFKNSKWKTRPVENCLHCNFWYVLLEQNSVIDMWKSTPIKRCKCTQNRRVHAGQEPYNMSLPRS